MRNRIIAKWFAKKLRETPMLIGVEIVHGFSKAQKLLALQFDKAYGFCVMIQTTYSDKLN